MISPGNNLIISSETPTKFLISSKGKVFDILVRNKRVTVSRDILKPAYFIKQKDNWKKLTRNENITKQKVEGSKNNCSVHFVTEFKYFIV